MTTDFLAIVFHTFHSTIFTTTTAFPNNNLYSERNAIAVLITPAILEMTFIRSSWHEAIHLLSCTCKGLVTCFCPKKGWIKIRKASFKYNSKKYQESFTQ